LPEFVHIIILDFTFIKDHIYHRTSFEIIEETGNKLTKNLRKHILEINKIKKLKNIDFNNPICRLMLFFNPTTSHETIEKIIKKDNVLKMAKLERDNLINDKDQLRERYIDKLEELTINTIKNSSKKEGKLEGREEIARNFKESGFPIDVISKNTGLSIEEIKKL